METSDPTAPLVVRSIAIVGIIWVMMVLGIRLYLRYKLNGPIGNDDYAAILATSLGVAQNGFSSSSFFTSDSSPLDCESTSFWAKSGCMGVVPLCKRISNGSGRAPPKNTHFANRFFLAALIFLLHGVIKLSVGDTNVGFLSGLCDQHHVRSSDGADVRALGQLLC